jgi:hypothetical protein
MLARDDRSAIGDHRRRLFLPNVQQQFAAGLDDISLLLRSSRVAGNRCEPLVGDLFGWVEGFGFVAEGDGADDNHKL